MLIWFLCAVAFLKVSQKIDSFMASIGVNVGHTGGSMLSEVLLVSKAISAAVGNAGHAIGGKGGGAGSTAKGANSTGNFFQGGLANLMISYTIQVFGAPSYASVNRVMSPIVIAIRTLSFLVVGNVYQKLGSYSYVSWIITGLLVISLICLLCVNSKTKELPGGFPGMPGQPPKQEA